MLPYTYTFVKLILFAIKARMSLAQNVNAFLSVPKVVGLLTNAFSLISRIRPPIFAETF